MRAEVLVCVEEGNPRASALLAVTTLILMIEAEFFDGIVFGMGR